MTADGRAAHRDRAALTFPCRFPVKVFGPHSARFERAVLAILGRHVAEPDRGPVHRQPSRRGRYVSITMTITAASRDQLDALYRELAEHDDVLMTL